MNKTTVSNQNRHVPVEGACIQIQNSQRIQGASCIADVDHSSAFEEMTMSSYMSGFSAVMSTHEVRFCKFRFFPTKAVLFFELAWLGFGFPCFLTMHFQGNRK